jgi:osmotically-inducible protein OsmY
VVAESEYVVAAVRERLAAGAAHELGVDVAVDDDRVTLSGVVDTTAAHDRVLAVVAEIAPDYTVVDDLEVLDPGSSPTVEQL